VDAETSWRVIEQERLSLAALLENLSDDQWNAPSLCEGWRVKDVAAHVALAAQPPSPLVMVVEGVRAHGQPSRLNCRDSGDRPLQAGEALKHGVGGGVIPVIR